MKKTILFMVIFVLSLRLTAQISEGGLPPSYKSSGIKSTAEIARYTLPDLDTAGLLAYNNENTLPFRYAVLEKVSIDLKSVATRTVLADGGSIWQYRINSPDGKSVQVIFDKYVVPEGAALYLYDDEYAEIKGAFTDFNMTTDLKFVIGDFPGDHVVIEYYEPAGAAFSGDLVIGAIGQGYTDIFDTKSKNTDSDGFISINCDEGIEWQDQKHAVCKYSFNDTKYSYLCSGSLINNTENNGTPYFLTANHCISSASEALTVVVYFNYENSSCSVISQYTSQSLSGSTLKTMGSASDYTLLLFSNDVPSSYQPYFAGWDVSGTAPESSVCIHHPGGDRKRISVDNDPAVSYAETITWDEGSDSPANTHWEVAWEEGITAGGSSGGPLFDNNKRIVGQLHGGGTNDYFGKLSYSWSNPKTTYSTLKSYLDPDNTNITALDSYYPSDNFPDARFVSDFSAVCLDAPVQLTGFSAFDPLTWEWSFSPSDVEYHDGTSAASQTPIVSFPTESNYNVTLKVSNIAGSDALTIDNFISAGTELTLETYPVEMSDSCACSFTGMKLLAYGADTYSWSLSDESDDYFYIDVNTSNPVEIKLKDGVELTQNTDIDITLTGLQGTCQSTILVTIPLEAQENDDIANAIEISVGENGPYSNSCASVEDNEPAPPYDSCTGQLSWCDEYGTGENIVERSVWFTYNPTVNQTVTIYSEGFDNQIAVYRAQSSWDILNGDYTLLAANDDYTNTNYDPHISSLAVEANQKYWIQVDGSAGGATGIFNLIISVLSSVGEDTFAGEEIIVYPQPADDVVTIESSAFAGCYPVRVELFDSSGRNVWQDTFTDASGIFTLNIGALPSGMYFARISCNNEVAVVKVVF